MPVVAYSPLEQGLLGGDFILCQIVARYDVTSLQIALA